MGNNYQLTSTNAGFPDSQSETVLIERRNKTGTNVLGEPIFNDASPLSIYSGTADLQIDDGDVVVTKEGEIINAAARCMIEGSGVSYLPIIEEGDRVTWNSEKFEVVIVEIWAFPYVHLELLLRRQVTW